MTDRDLIQEARLTSLPSPLSLTRKLADALEAAVAREERLYDLVSAQLEEEFDAAGYDGETETLAALERIKASVNVWLAQRSSASSVSAESADEWVERAQAEQDEYKALVASGEIVTEPATEEKP